MKTTKEVLEFCNEYTFYDLYNIDRVIKLSHIRDFMNNVLLESDFKLEDNRIRAMGIVGDISLLLIDGAKQNFEHEISKVRFAILQLVCLERLYTKRDIEKRPNLIKDGRWRRT